MHFLWGGNVELKLFKKYYYSISMFFFFKFPLLAVSLAGDALLISPHEPSEMLGTGVLQQCSACTAATKVLPSESPPPPFLC